MANYSYPLVCGMPLVAPRWAVSRFSADPSVFDLSECASEPSGSARASAPKDRGLAMGIPRHSALMLGAHDFVEFTL